MRVHYQDKAAVSLIAKELKPYLKGEVIIICVGTDRCTGDALGPILGTFLTNDETFKIKVFGTLDRPIHALNIEDFINNIKLIHPNSKVIAIDACLGPYDKVGEIRVRNKPINPGKGVGKDLPEIGDTSIVAIIDDADIMIPFTNRPVRLGFVYDLAEVIYQGIVKAYLENKVSLFNRIFGRLTVNEI